MPTVKELEFDEEEYETDSDEEEEEEEGVSIVERLKETCDKMYAVAMGPVADYGSKGLWITLTTALVVVFPIVFGVEREHVFQEQMEQMRQQQAAAQSAAAPGGAPKPAAGPSFSPLG